MRTISTRTPPTRSHDQPLVAALDILGGKWTLLIIHGLMDGPRRFGQLRCAVPEASAKMLAQRLHELIAQGLIARQVVTAQPLQVMYQLTPPTVALSLTLAALRAWGLQYAAPTDVNDVLPLCRKHALAS